MFLALPHGASQRLVPDLLAAAPGTRIVDLAADFRLKDPSAYERWYGEAHQRPRPARPLRLRAPRAAPQGASPAPTAVAAPGCYPTAAALALAPLVAAGVIETEGIVVDAASGVSGAGRTLKPHVALRHRQRGLRGLRAPRPPPHARDRAGHRRHRAVHAPPGPHDPGHPGHLLRPARPGPRRPRPCSTCSATPTTASRSWSWATSPPSTKATWGSNTAHLTARYDARTGWVVVLAAIDNLVKGASGQAVQCANIVLGLDETAGLSPIGVYP